MSFAGLPSWAAPYVGLPWREMGRDRAGLDCWGLFRLVMGERFGIALPAYDGLGWGETAKAELGRFMRAAAERPEWLAIDPGLEREGDGVLLRAAGAPIHVGLVLAPGLMLHIEQDIDSCVERYDRAHWAPRVIGFYRHAQRLD